MATELNKELENPIDSGEFDPDVTERYLRRILEGNLTRDENPYTHFCIYFAAFDALKHSVFVGHHKKSGLWLFNGDHIDKGESLSEALEREISEEWGIKIPIEDLKKPLLLTVTKIPPNQKQICKTHYDVWYFVPIKIDTARFNQDLLSKEFLENSWLTIPDARSRITDPSTLKALVLLEQRLK